MLDVPFGDPDVPGFGRWAYDYTTDSWWWSDEMIAMYDADLSNPGDVEAVFARLHQDDREPIRERLGAAMEAGESLSGQYRFTTISRGERVFAFVGDPVRLDHHTVTTLRGYTIDVTDEVGRLADQAVVGATQSRAAIEQVKGALMLSYQVTDAVAFETLRRYSMLHNVKLAALATRVVERMASPDDQAMSGDRRTSMMRLLDEVVDELTPARRR